MAWKSFYIAAGMVNAAALPFLKSISGGMNLPDGPCIIAANHSSFLDGPLLALAYARLKYKPLHMVAYEEPFNNWLMGWVLRSGRCIPFRRGNNHSQYDMLKTALGWLATGEAVGIFPEGHINQAEYLNRPRQGAAMLALESGLPIIPAAIIGSSETLPLGKSIPRAGRRITIHFGQSIGIFPKERTYCQADRDDRKNMLKSLSIRIMNELEKLTGRKQRPHTRNEKANTDDV